MYVPDSERKPKGQSNIDNPEKLAMRKPKGQSRETGNIVYTGRRKT